MQFKPIPFTQSAASPFFSLKMMLALLITLFVIAQIVFSYLHYHFSGMTDSLGNTTVLEQLRYPVVLLPMLGFVALQLLAYVLLVMWLHFLVQAYGDLFKLSLLGRYWRGAIIAVLACLGIFVANTYFYPHSFFAPDFLVHSSWHAPFIFTWAIFFIFFFLTLLAFAQFFIFKARYWMSAITLLIAIIMTLGIGAWNHLARFMYHPATPPAQPNIIFIGVDSVRPDFVSYFNPAHTRTPAIDHFLQHSVVLTQSYTPLARTFPSWTSILTSRYPLHSGARNNLVEASDVLPNDTLAKVLQKAGYITYYATDEKRFSNITKGYGFNHIIGPYMGANDFLLSGLPDLPLTNLLVNMPFGRFLFPYNYGNRAAAVTYEPNNFEQLLASHLPTQGNKPFFIAIHFCISHWPYTWAKDGIKTPITNEAYYVHGLRAVDRSLAQTLALLRAKGLLQHTVVVLLSDHGTALGLMGDRVIRDDHFVGDQNEIATVTHYPLQSASPFSASPSNYSINTSFGQGTDVLSLQQYHTLLAFQGFGVNLPHRDIDTPTSLLNLAPTILDWLHLPPLPQSDGVAMRAVFTPTVAVNWQRPQFWETGDKFGAIETDKINIEKVLEARVSMYAIDPKSGLLYLRPVYEQSLIQNKQRSIWLGDWMLARMPPHVEVRYLPESPGSEILKPTPTNMPAQYILVNLKTGKWGIGLNSPLAKQAPIALLYQKLREFYGAELNDA